MEITQIDKHTWGILDDFVRFFVLEGDEKALVIDSGVSGLNVKEIAEGLTSKPVELINTHSDFDHSNGNDSFEWFYMSEKDYGNIKEVFKSRPVYVKEGDVIELGNRPIKILEVPGHTEGSIALIDMKNRVLYPGDVISTDYIFMFGDQRNPDKYLKSLEKLEKLTDEFDYIHPNHATPLLKNTAVSLVKEDFIKVMKNELPFKLEFEEKFGTKIRAYWGDFTGFYMPEDFNGCY